MKLPPKHTVWGKHSLQIKFNLSENSSLDTEKSTSEKEPGLQN
jgi:hypothetical protein